jgi:limonene-1,2-epoxide hydrolase
VDRAEAAGYLEQRRQAWLREDVDAYLRMFHDDFTFSANGVELITGRLALENAVRRSYLRFRPISWEFHDIAVHDANVLSEWTVAIEARTSGAIRAVRAMSICEIHDGLTTWQREYRAPPGDG